MILDVMQQQKKICFHLGLASSLGSASLVEASLTTGKAAAIAAEELGASIEEQAPKRLFDERDESVLAAKVQQLWTRTSLLPLHKNHNWSELDYLMYCSANKCCWSRAD